MSANEEQIHPAPADAHLKSLKHAYLLLGLVGLFGAHRFYLGKWLSGAAYALVFMATLIVWEELVLGALVLGLLVDAFLLPGMVEKRNQWIAEHYAENPNRYHRETDETIAPWAREKKTGFWHAIQAPGRIYSFIVLPAIYTIFLVETGNYEFIVFPVIILLATGLFTSLDEIAHRHPAVFELPGIESALARVKEMRAYYWDHEPLMRPPLLRIFTRATSEFAPFWKIVGLIVLAILLDLAFSYGDDYGKYMDPLDALVIIGLHISLNAYAVLIILSQLSAMSFHYSLSGKPIRLRILTLSALIMTALFFVVLVGIKNDPGQVSMLSAERLALRKKNEEFLDALIDNSTMFIQYYGPPLETFAMDPDAENSELACTHETSINECLPTEWLRELLAGIAPNDEAQSFHVFDAWYDDGQTRSAWRGVRYETPTEREVVVATNGYTTCQNYTELTPECVVVLNQFVNLEGEEPMLLLDPDAGELSGQ